MATLTDAARELAEVCEDLAKRNVRQHGDVVLADAFGVSAWSTEFYQIICTILNRANHLKELVQQLDMDEDFKVAAQLHLEHIERAFSGEGLKNGWQHAVDHFIGPQHVAPVKMLSPLVRPLQSFPRLENAEIGELLQMAEELQAWLQEHQLHEQDFIRQLLIEGLSHFHFRLTHLKWVGTGFALEGLREVITAYLALERGVPDPSSAPAADAVLRRTGAFIKAAYEKVKTAKDVVETADFLLKAYGAVSLARGAASGIAGLLGAS